MLLDNINSAEATKTSFNHFATLTMKVSLNKLCECFMLSKDTSKLFELKIALLIANDMKWTTLSNKKKVIA